MFKIIAQIRKYSFSRKAVILFHIGLSALIVLAPLIWLFDTIQIHWGEDAAIIVLTLTFIVVIVIVAGSMGIGLCIDYAICRRKFIFHSPKPGNWVERVIRIWGHNLADPPKKEAKCFLPCPVTSQTCTTVIDHPKLAPKSVLANPEASTIKPIAGEPIPERAKRRGRRPSFPLPRWMDVALVWELRDPIFDTFTLSDVISQKLGKAPNGEPIIGDGAYYATWRLPAIREINRLGLTNHPLSEDLQSNDEVRELL
jgi:hypothetical protein